MSSSDRKFLPRLLLGAVLLCALAASGCQVRPLYATNSGTEAALKSISFSEATTRVGLEVRNQLVFMTSGGAGEPAKPDYDVDLRIKERNVGVLINESTDLPRAGRLVLVADFTLKRRSTGEVLKTGRRSTVALADFSEQEFAKIRAIRDAENRAARELAELIRADLAAWLGR